MPAPTAAQAADPADPRSVLHTERAHLADSRACLRRMREGVLSLDAQGGNAYSTEVLKAALHHRAEALRDLPDTPLFFGRLDYAAPAERFYIGRRHVHDDRGDPMVIDWRAPISRPFYRAAPSEPMGLRLRRRFGYSGGELTAYEDEEFAPGRSPAGGPRPAGGPSRILVEEIERPRTGPMRDIVATIQPEQDDIVRADAEASICVQGAPGTGKTAVGLHRVAYLLYAHRDRMRRGGVLVVGPNSAFLGYIRHVLPALGELDVTQVTLPELLDTVPIRAADDPEAARIKGDARMAEVIRRAVWAHVRESGEPVLLPRGSRRWRVPGYEVAELVAELRARGLRYAAGREALGNRIAHVILTRMEESGEPCDDRTHDAVRRSRPVRAAVDAVWPALDPVRVVLRLLGDPGALAAAAAGLLDDAEQRAIRWPAPPRGPRSARWSPADAVLVDEARDCLERIPSVRHVVLDEAQDLSPMQCRAVGRRCATGSATVLGDIAQGTTPWATDDWPSLLTHLGKPDAEIRVLDRGYRVPRQILAFAARLLPAIGPGLVAPDSVRQAAGSLRVRRVPAGGLGRELAGACAEALAEEGSIAVIGADDQLAELARQLDRAGVGHTRLDAPAPAGGANRLALVPAGLAKGLEFDHVIVVEPARIAAGEARGLRRLYVVLTRAVSRLTVLHAEPLPAPLLG